MRNQRNPGAKLGRLRKLRDGLAEVHPEGNEQIQVKGVNRPVSDIVSQTDGYILIFGDAEKAHETLTMKVEARDAAEPQVDLFLEAMEDALRSIYGRRAQMLKRFGLPPKKQAKKLTSKANAQRADKAMASRKRNHTMGPRQKKEAKKENANPPAPQQSGSTEPPKPENGAAGK